MERELIAFYLSSGTRRDFSVKFEKSNKEKQKSFSGRREMKFSEAATSLTRFVNLATNYPANRVKLKFRETWNLNIH